MPFHPLLRRKKETDMPALRMILVVFALLLSMSVAAAPAADAAASWPSVSQGATGDNVRTVQYLLRQHGHGVVVDGQFGPQTRAAVVSFQAARGLVADGVVGPQTWPRLIVSVRSGSRGDAVRAAQVQLNRHGAGLAVDGVFGAQTNAAARSFQAAHGLVVDGLVGPQTWQALVGGGGGNPPSGVALPLARNAVPRAAYGIAHWNATPAVDLMVSYVPAYAVIDGYVDHYWSASCGIGIRLVRGDGSRVVYCHLSSRAVGEGWVSAGTRIATTGDTGNSGDPHLHVEIRDHNGVARCPQPWLLAVHDGVQPPSFSSLTTVGCHA